MSITSRKSWSESYELVWVGNHPGIRESRRLEGIYVLTENDILDNRIFDDAVAYGGWPMDEHTAGGIDAKGIIPSRVRSFEGLYSIPYRCYCSKTIKNMMMAGRNIGASRMAMGSTRVMGTCAIGGQAVGIAAAMAAQNGCLPEEVGEKFIWNLRQELLKDDCYIPACRNEDPCDLARTAVVTASSYKDDCIPENVINGVSRIEGEQKNMWCSDGFAEEGEWISLKLNKEEAVKQIRITFDPNLSEEHCISLSKAVIEKIPQGVPAELVKDYNIRLSLKGDQVFSKEIQGNYQRLNIIELEKEICADELIVSIASTNGVRQARIFEVRIY